MPIDVVVMKAVNAENAERAAEVRQRLIEAGVLGLNLMSSPGSGKTTLLEATLEKLAGRWRMAVIEGDVFTTLDAERIERQGAPVIQVNTEGSCHMTAHMILALLDKLDLNNLDLLVIENIGNLICPASFDLGEHSRVALLSTTEGQDKVAKYPKLFSISHVNLITKVDLAPLVDFDVTQVEAELHQLNPTAEVISTSARDGQGIERWIQWVENQRQTLDQPD